MRHWRRLGAIFATLCALGAQAAFSQSTKTLDLSLTEVDIRFNRAARQLNSHLTLELEGCETKEKSVCRYKVSESLQVLAVSEAAGRNLSQLVAIYVQGAGGSAREAVLLQETLIAMLAPDMSASERSQLVAYLIGYIDQGRRAQKSIDGLRYRMQASAKTGLWMYIEPTD